MTFSPATTADGDFQVDHDFLIFAGWSSPNFVATNATTVSLSTRHPRDAQQTSRGQRRWLLQSR
jgi:hypothetical protein